MNQTPRSPIEEKLAAALQKQSAVWTPECPDSDAWYDWIEQGDKFADAERLAKHLFTCGFCRREYDVIRETLALAAETMPIAQGANLPVSSEAAPFAARLRDWLASLAARPLPTAFAVAAALLLLFLGIRTFSGQQQIAALDRKLNAAKQQAVADDLQKEKGVAALAQQNEEKARQLQKMQSELAEAKSKNSGATDTQKVVLKDGDTQIVEDNGGQFHRISMPLAPEVIQALKAPAKALLLAANVATTLSNLRGSLNETRGGSNDEAVQLISPPAQIIEEDTPDFQWKDHSKAFQYELHIENNDGSDTLPPFIIKSPATHFTLQKPLQRGKVYSWSIIAENEPGNRIGPDGEPLTGISLPQKKSFAVLGDSEYKKLQSNRQSPLTLGILYARFGLFDKAEKEFENLKGNNSDSRLLDQLIQQTRTLREKAEQIKKSEAP